MTADVNQDTGRSETLTRASDSGALIAHAQDEERRKYAQKNHCVHRPPEIKRLQARVNRRPEQLPSIPDANRSAMQAEIHP